jgi:hypothetical protein
VRGADYLDDARALASHNTIDLHGLFTGLPLLLLFFCMSSYVCEELLSFFFVEIV